eukprot:TRINITY_DN9272_c0_g2_i1.p1 TRINITY_DN9272_c0_g2~~TRINITY_DN9272_c0_g2_i1.p1  ORF type:complete len:447 (+),score=102.32 TRINITY_DN9272_c0_g2_i1:77-1342(+)
MAARSAQLGSRVPGRSPAEERAVVEREASNVRSELSKLYGELAVLERMEDDLVSNRGVLSGQALAYRVQRTVAQQQNVAMAINTVPELFERPPASQPANGRRAVLRRSDDAPAAPARGPLRLPADSAPAAASTEPPVPRRRGTAVPPSSGAAPAPPPRQPTEGTAAADDGDVMFDCLAHDLTRRGEWPRSICEIAVRATKCESLSAAERWLREHPQQVAIARKAEGAAPAAVAAPPPNATVDEEGPPPPPPARRLSAELAPAPPPRRAPAPAPQQQAPQQQQPPPRAAPRPQPQWLRQQPAPRTEAAPDAAAPAPAFAAAPPAEAAPAYSGPPCSLTVRNLSGAKLSLPPLPADAPLSVVCRTLVEGPYDLGRGAHAIYGTFLLSVPHPRRTIPVEEMPTTTLRALGLHPNGVLNMVPIEA